MTRSKTKQVNKQSLSPLLSTNFVAESFMSFVCRFGLLSRAKFWQKDRQTDGRTSSAVVIIVIVMVIVIACRLPERNRQSSSLYAMKNELVIQKSSHKSLHLSSKLLSLFTIDRNTLLRFKFEGRDLNMTCISSRLFSK